MTYYLLNSITIIYYQAFHHARFPPNGFIAKRATALFPGTVGPEVDIFPARPFTVELRSSSLIDVLL